MCLQVRPQTLQKLVLTQAQGTQTIRHPAKVAGVSQMLVALRQRQTAALRKESEASDPGSPRSSWKQTAHLIDVFIHRAKWRRHPALAFLRDLLGLFLCLLQQHAIAYALKSNSFATAALDQSS